MYFQYSQVFHKWIKMRVTGLLSAVFDSKLKTIWDSEWNHELKRCVFSRPTKWVYGLICSDELYGSYDQNSKKKKKKKKGGGVFVAVQWGIFSACVALNATSEIVIKVFPLSKGNTFLYFVWLLLLFFFFRSRCKKTIRHVAFNF